MKYAVAFPGQGSQQEGMGAELFAARPDLLGDQADQILGWSLQDVCLHGSTEDLTRTERAQPAIYALSYVLWQEFTRLGIPAPAGGVGHSLGEYTALAAAQLFTFEEGLRLVSARGQAMAQASDREPSSMAALLGADQETAEALSAARRDQGGRLWVANLNAPGQVVVAGGADDIQWSVEQAADYGFRRVVELNVAGAFHTPFMETAVPRLEEALRGVPFQEPSFAVWSNVTARPVALPDAPGLLAQQVVAPVRFAQSLTSMAAQGINIFVHVGPGNVTAGFVKRAVPDAQSLVVNSLASARQVAEVLKDLAGK